eukprot:1011352_1
MWKQIGLLVVVYLTLGQSMDSGSPEFSSDSDNIDRTTRELYLIDEVQTAFTKWKQSKPLIVWSEDKILKDQQKAMEHVFDRFSDFGGTAFGDFILLIDDYHGGELNRDDTSTDLLAATIEMNAAAQQEMDRVISVILNEVKSMVEDGESNGSRSKVVLSLLYNIASKYNSVGVPMDKVLPKIEGFEMSLDSNIPPWMRKILDKVYKGVYKDIIVEDEDTPSDLRGVYEQKIFDMVSKKAGPLRELSEPVKLPELSKPTDRTEITETATVSPVGIEQWFPLSPITPQHPVVQSKTPIATQPTHDQRDMTPSKQSFIKAASAFAAEDPVENPSNVHQQLGEKETDIDALPSQPALFFLGLT